MGQGERNFKIYFAYGLEVSCAKDMKDPRILASATGGLELPFTALYDVQDSFPQQRLIRPGTGVVV